MILTARKKNNNVMIVECERGPAMELTEFFSFFVPNYKFMPAFKNTPWDGKIKLFNPINHELPIGLYTHLKSFCDKRNYTLDGDEILLVNKINPKEIMKFVKDLNPHSKGEPIQIRESQFNSVCHSLKHQRTVLVAPTAVGKSFIIYVLMRWFLENFDEKFLIIVPTTSLVDQMYTDFADYSSHDDSFDVNETCHQIYSGKEKNIIEKRVVISTWQSIYKLPKKWFNPYKFIIGDECHGFKSDSLKAIMSKCDNADWRIGATGTLDGTLTHKLVLEGIFGKVLKVTTTKELQDAGILSNLEIKILALKYPEAESKALGKITYQEEIDYIVRHKKRNEFIAKLAVTQKGNTLVLFNFVTKRGACRGVNSKISWTQVETGSAITWKYPSCILQGDNSKGEFYSVAITNNFQQADTGTKMIHIGKNTSSKIISKGISAGNASNTYRGLVKIQSSATNARNFTQCDSLLIGNECGAHTVPYIESSNSGAQVEHEATTSKINEDQLFYCQQRGLSNEEAIGLIVNGFCKEVLQHLPMEFAVEAQKLVSISLEGSVG